MPTPDRETVAPEEDFENQPIETLAAQHVAGLEELDTLLTEGSKTDAKQLDKLENLEVERLEQANSLRSCFFWVGVGLAVACVLTSMAMVLFMLFCRQISDPVAIAFMTGLTVEVLGIMVIIANYLFPSGNGKKEEKKEKQLS